MSSYSVIHNNGSTNYFCLTLVFLLVYCANGCFASKVIDEDSLDLAKVTNAFQHRIFLINYRKALDAAVITTLETGEVQQLITQAGFTFTLAKVLLFCLLFTQFRFFKGLRFEFGWNVARCGYC